VSEGSGEANADVTFVRAVEAAGFVDLQWSRSPAAPLLQSLVADPLLRPIIEALDPATVAEVAGTIFSYRVEARRPA